MEPEPIARFSHTGPLLREDYVAIIEESRHYLYQGTGEAIAKARQLEARNKDRVYSSQLALSLRNELVIILASYLEPAYIYILSSILPCKIEF